jgi:hypothetical protein
VIKAMDEATVTSPPPELLYTTSPVLVAIAVAPLGVVGARARLVGGGTVDAVRADDAANALLRDACALVSEASWLLTDAEALEPVALAAADERLLATDDRLLAAEERLLDAVVVALLFWRLARDRRLVASGGFSE